VKTISVLIFSIILMVGCEKPEVVGENPIDPIFTKWNSDTSPGCSVAASDNGQLVLSSSYGMANLDHTVPIDGETIFHVASVSKQFTAASIALLSAEGKLSLDDDVRDYIDELPDFGSKITIRHLIHHTSGLRDQWALLSMTGWRYSQDLISTADVMSIIKHQKSLNFEPGSEHLYSNTGYTLLALIVERVSGLTFREFTTERLFKPLGMNSTFFRDNFREIVKGQAYGYIENPDEKNTYLTSVTNFDTVGATSLMTTATDLLKWAHNFETPLVGDQAFVEQLAVRGKLNSGESIDYAFGQVHGTYRGQSTVSHGGGDAGYRSYLLRFPHLMFDIAVLCNTTANTSQLAYSMADTLISGKLTPEEDTKTDKTSLPAGQKVVRLNGKAGTFWNEKAQSAIGFTVTGEKLYLDFQNVAYEMAPIRDNQFRMLVNDMVVEFSQDNSSLRSYVGQENETTYIRSAAFVPTPEDLQSFAGSYRSDELEVLYHLSINADGALNLEFLKSGPIVLEPHIMDIFIGANGTLKFERNEDLNISGFSITSGRIRNLAFTKI
jgi:CubicO group peptidase (beta-lactamase class C family)